MTTDTPPELIGPVALAIDELLTTMTAADLDALRAAAPIGHLDQVDAATSSGLRALTNTPDFHTPTLRAVTDIPEWVRLGAFTTLATWGIGRHRSCVHNPDHANPQPIHSAAWAPDLITCSNCTHLLRLPKSTATDRRCDGCGHVTAGPDAGDPMNPFAVVLGVLTYRIGACNNCRFWDQTT